ncbi:MAG TPA: hypothetical protein VIM64_14770, partial [Puia sp.]
MKRLTIYCAFSCLLAACNKHHDKPGDGGQGPNHGTVIRLKTAGANAYNYDGLGRLIRTDYSNSIDGRSDYTYTKDSVVEKDFDQQGRRQGPILIYYLDSDTLTSHIRYIFDASVPALFFNLTYDTEKRLIEEIVGDEGSPPDTRVINSYRNGNEDSSRQFSVETGQLIELTTYEYYTDKPNWLDLAHNGISYVGKDNANLLKKIVEMQPGDTTVIEYTYEFDSDNKPVKRQAFLNGAPWG